MDFSFLPIGSITGVAENERALAAYNRLTEAEKEQVIFECKDAKSQSEVEEIIDRLNGRWF